MFILLGIEASLLTVCFRKNYYKVNDNLKLGILIASNILVDILNISYSNKVLGWVHASSDDYTINIRDLLEVYSSYGLLLIGLHNFTMLYYCSVKFSDMKYRYEKIQEKRKKQKEKKAQESSNQYLIFERLEQKPIEKAYQLLQQFQLRLPKNEKQVNHDFDFILKAIKEALENDKNQILQIEKQTRGAKRIGDREDGPMLGQGLIRDANVVEHHFKRPQYLSDQDNNDDEQQYYSDIQRRMLSSHAGRHSTSNNRMSVSLSKEFTVDPIKLSKYLSDYNKGIENCLNKLDSFEFDIFNLRSISSGKELIILGYEIAQSQNLIDSNHMSKFVYLSFLQGIAQSYNNVAYHSKTHAGDVLQGLHYFLKTGEMAELLKLTPVEHIGAIVAAIAHDLDHPGFNNQFLVSTRDEIALLYNDQSVLENHHVAQTFLLLRQDELNIFKRFSQQNQNKIREIMIKMVLATDMFYHASNMQQMQKIIEKTSHDPSVEISNNQVLISEEELQQNKIFLLGQSLHFADISNPCREWSVSSRWTDLVFREFFYQGDLERSMNLPISNLMDKKTVNIAQSQVGFINFLVLPVFSEFSKICRNCEPLILQAQQNRKKWEGLKDVFEMHKEAQLRQINSGDITGMEDIYFSYDNYLKRRMANSSNQQNSTSAASNHSPNFMNHAGSSPNHSKLNVSSRQQSNQRLSFLTNRSKNSNNRQIMYNQNTLQGSDKNTRVFVLQEEKSDESSSSDSLQSPKKENTGLGTSYRDKEVENLKVPLNDQSLEDDDDEEDDDEDDDDDERQYKSRDDYDEENLADNSYNKYYDRKLSSKSDQTSKIVGWKQSNKNSDQQINSHRFQMKRDTAKEVCTKQIAEISISMSKDYINEESMERIIIDQQIKNQETQNQKKSSNKGEKKKQKILGNKLSLMGRSQHPDKHQIIIKRESKPINKQMC